MGERFVETMEELDEGLILNRVLRKRWSVHQYVVTYTDGVIARATPKDNYLNKIILTQSFLDGINEEKDHLFFDAQEALSFMNNYGWEEVDTVEDISKERFIHYLVQKSYASANATEQKTIERLSEELLGISVPE